MDPRFGLDGPGGYSEGRVVPLPQSAGASERPRGPGAGKGMGNPGQYGGAGRPPPPSIDPSVGDWQCPQCSNWNWARRSECNKCGTGHPTRAPGPPSKGADKANQAVGLDPYGGYGTAGSQKRTGEGGGFKEFDEEEDDRRKRRAYEASREKEERKAEKKKCEFCKRFSCIC